MQDEKRNPKRPPYLQRVFYRCCKTDRERLAFPAYSEVRRGTVAGKQEPPSEAEVRGIPLKRAAIEPRISQRGLASLSRNPKKRRATTDHTDFTDKTMQESAGIANRLCWLSSSESSVPRSCAALSR